MMKHALCERQPNHYARIRGLSCDDEGVFIAGDVPLIFRHTTTLRGIFYRPRPALEIQTLLAAAYGAERDFSAPIAGLQLVARYMNESKWILAKIASVHLRLPEGDDDLALAKLLATQAGYLGKRCSDGDGRSGGPIRLATKRDVSDEPRIPAGQRGGEWTTDRGNVTEQEVSNPSVIPAQAIAPPVPLPIPFELPLPPTEIAPFPFAIPGEGLKPPLVNPYPNKRKCVKEWEEAEKFCEEQRRQKKLKPGYGGYGKDVERCILGQVSAECGGNPTA
jgi:hypothetical protein